MADKKVHTDICGNMSIDDIFLSQKIGIHFQKLHIIILRGVDNMIDQETRC